MKQFLFILMIIPFISYGQEQDDYLGDGFLGYVGNEKIITVIQANKFITNKANIKFTLKGSVIMQIDETKINCDSAIIDYDRSILVAYGNVVITSTHDIQLHTAYIYFNLINTKMIISDDKYLK